MRRVVELRQQVARKFLLELFPLVGMEAEIVGPDHDVRLVLDDAGEELEQ